MTEPPPADLELPIRAACAAGQLEQATTLLMEAYGAELYSFALAQFRTRPDAAEDVFASFSEDLWRGVGSFHWQCPARAWCYRLLRSAAARYRRAPSNRPGRRVALSESPLIEQAVQRVRSATLPYLRTEVKDAFQTLRDQLSPEDRDLLTLRVDRQLSWRDIACAMAGDEDTDAPGGLQRLEVNLRQRFSEVKKRLKKLAIESGLLPRSDEED